MKLKHENRNRVWKIEKHWDTDEIQCQSINIWRLKAKPGNENCNLNPEHIYEKLEQNYLYAICYDSLIIVS